MREPALSVKMSNMTVIPLALQVSLDDGNHLPSDGLSAFFLSISIKNIEKNVTWPNQLLNAFLFVIDIEITFFVIFICLSVPLYANHFETNIQLIIFDMITIIVDCHIGYILSRRVSLGYVFKIWY